MTNWSIDKIEELLNQAGNYSNCHCDNCVKFHSQSKEIIQFLLDERERVRREVWDEAIRIAQESAKKSGAARLNTSAAEIVIRRLEIARDNKKGE